MLNSELPDFPPGQTPVGSPFVVPGENLHCRQVLYVLSDVEGRTWIGVGPGEEVDPGGVMSHLLPGQDALVVSSTAESLIVRLPRVNIGGEESAQDDRDDHFAGTDTDVPAYPLSAVLVPSLSSTAPATTRSPQSR